MLLTKKDSKVEKKEPMR